MEAMVHSVKISARNQVALPAEELEAVGAQQGERLLVRAKDGVLVLIPEHLAEEILDRGLAAFRQAGLEAFEDLWDNPDDEAWDEA